MLQLEAQVAGDANKILFRHLFLVLEETKVFNFLQSSVYKYELRNLVCSALLFGRN